MYNDGKVWQCKAKSGVHKENFDSSFFKNGKVINYLLEGVN